MSTSSIGSPWRTMRIASVAALMLLLGALEACSDTPESAGPPPATVPDGTPFTDGLSLAPGSGFGATEWDGDPSECAKSGQILIDNKVRYIEIAAWPPQCEQAQSLNGRLERHNTAADVIDPNQVGVQRVTAGTAYAFDQTYTACTSKCHDFLYRFVLLELDKPVDPDRPTVQIGFCAGCTFVTRDVDVVSVAELFAIADAVRTHP